MALFALTDAEREIVRRAMEATFQYFDVDFQTRLGVNKEQMQALLAAWPDVDDRGDGSDACLAISNALNDLLNGVGISDELAQRIIGADRVEIERVYDKWAAARGWK